MNHKLISFALSCILLGFLIGAAIIITGLALSSSGVFLVKLFCVFLYIMIVWGIRIIFTDYQKLKKEMK
jgi:hypothetical protein